MNKIQIIKQELKRIASVRKFQKIGERKNQSLYDTLVDIPMREAKSNGKIRDWKHELETNREFMVKYEEKKVKIEEKISSERITCLHILYNELRNKPPHTGCKEKENGFKVYSWYTDCVEWLEEKASLLQVTESEHDYEKSSSDV